MSIPLGDGPLGALDERMFKHNHKIGLLGFQSKVVELTSAELLALNATAKTLVPAPGKGRGLIFDGMLVQYRHGTVEYVSQAGAGAVTNRIVASVNLTNIAFTIAAQPQAPSYITGTITDSTPSITVGTLTIVGKDRWGNSITEVIDVAKIAVLTAASITFRTQQIFAYVDSVTAAAFATLGGAGNETIIVGTEFATAEDFGVYYGSLASGSARRVGVLHSQGFLRMSQPTVAGHLVASVNLTNVALTLRAVAAALPAPAAVLVTIVDTTPSITAGQIVITGTDQAGAVQGETITFVSGTLVYVSTLAYATVTSIVTVGFTVLGGAGDETIQVGTTSGPKLAYVKPEFSSIVPPDNTALVLAMDTGEIASGNGTAVVRVFYRTVELALRG